MRSEAVDRTFAAKKKKKMANMFFFPSLFQQRSHQISRIPSILYLNSRELWEFKKVMQTLDTIKGLHSFRKYPKKFLPIHVLVYFL